MSGMAVQARGDAKVRRYSREESRWRRTAPCPASSMATGAGVRHCLVEGLRGGRSEQVCAFAVGLHGAGCGETVLPTQSDGQASACAQALDLSLRPSGGQRGQKVDAPAWLCSSISAMAAVAPKLPSIWKIGRLAGGMGVEQIAVRCCAASAWRAIPRPCRHRAGAPRSRWPRRGSSRCRRRRRPDGVRARRARLSPDPALRAA